MWMRLFESIDHTVRYINPVKKNTVAIRMP